MITNEFLIKKGFVYNQAYNFWEGTSGVPDLEEIYNGSSQTVYYKFGPDKEDFVPIIDLHTENDIEKLIKNYFKT